MGFIVTELYRMFRSRICFLKSFYFYAELWESLYTGTCRFIHMKRLNLSHMTNGQGIFICLFIYLMYWGPNRNPKQHTSFSFPFFSLNHRWSTGPRSPPSQMLYGTGHSNQGLPDPCSTQTTPPPHLCSTTGARESKWKAVCFSSTWFNLTMINDA